MSAPTVMPIMPMPEGAKHIRFVLKDVRIVGATVFSPAQLADIYKPYLNRDITLDVVYSMANLITERYRSAGYFLSLAYLPDQRAGNGVITLQVVEGYISTVELPKEVETPRVIKAYIDGLIAQKPITAQAIESFLLRLNDLPGYSFVGTLSAVAGAKDGAVKMTLQVSDKEGKGQISFDNFSSRFLGPNEVSASYAKSLLPLQQTTVSVLGSLPTDGVKYATLSHAIVLAPDITLEALGSFTKANPGYSLEPYDIQSESAFLSAGFTYQWIRQRQENLSLKVVLDSRNSNSDLLGVQFTRDRIRSLRMSANYDTADSWRGYNVASFKISQGIEGFGSSRKGEKNLSRAEASPHFTKFELSLSRQQVITEDWSLLMNTSAQAASGPLFSSEEFGYGGQSLGRAFDSSELTGDHGIAGSLEIRYGGWNDLQPVSVSPYTFYDIGTVWNEDIAQVKHESGASAGFGIRAANRFGINGNIGLAWPLMPDIATPIYGQTKTGPRILLQISKDF